MNRSALSTTPSQIHHTQRFVQVAWFEVPLGQRRVVGVVMECLSEPSQDLDAAQIKDIIEPLVEHPPIPEAILKVIKFGTDYYGVPLGDFVELILPAIVKEGSRRYGVNSAGVEESISMPNS